jgi:hypothetical protein
VFFPVIYRHYIVPAIIYIYIGFQVVFQVETPEYIIVVEQYDIGESQFPDSRPDIVGKPFTVDLIKKTKKRGAWQPVDRFNNRSGIKVPHIGSYLNERRRFSLDDSFMVKNIFLLVLEQCTPVEGRIHI